MVSQNSFVVICLAIIFNLAQNYAIQIKDSTSNENVTILHEVSLNEDPLDLNTHEILPSKSVKKTEILKPVQEFTDHAISFDFNLDDLEDVHGAEKDVGLTPDEKNLLRDQDVASPHIFKVLKPKTAKNKGREDFQKNLGSHFNSIDRVPGSAANSTDNLGTTEMFGSDQHLFQVIVNLYDHFYWQPEEIRKKVSPVCGVEVLSYLSALNNNYDWAQMAYDTSGHFRGQLMFGNDKWLGQKRFCNEMSSGLFKSDRKHFDFGFYTAAIHIRARLPQNLTVVIQLGECLPKSCSAKDVQEILELDPHAKSFGLSSNPPNGTQLKVLRVRKVPGSYCLWKDVKFLIFGGVCFCILITIIIATWYESQLATQESPKITQVATNNSANGTHTKGFELYQINGRENNNIENGDDSNKMKKSETAIQDEKKDIPELGYGQKLLMCFALPSNANTILSVKRNKDEIISCVHGLRVLAVLWTIFVHTYLEVFNIGENKGLRKLSENTFLYQMIGNATFSVDTFFFISGMLVTLIFLRQSKKSDEEEPTEEFVKKGATQSGLLILYRYIRLTPAYMFVIAFNEFSLRYIFDRSVLDPKFPTDTCSNYWYRNILYTNNFYPLSEMCMSWSWYMANDMQFYILAIILLIASKRYFKASFLILMAFLITSWAISGIISIYFNYIHKVAVPFESFDFLYDKPWQRIGTYIVGMTTGYVIYKIKTPPKVSFSVNLLLWLCSLGLIFIIIFGVWNGQLSVLATAFYVSLGHTAFGMALVWIVLSCAWGLANPINKFLSYEGWMPLSRLTYCTYLVHPVIMLAVSFSMDGPIHLDHAMIYIIFLGNAVLSFVAGFFISVTFEAPVIRVLKVIFKK